MNAEFPDWISTENIALMREYNLMLKPAAAGTWHVEWTNGDKWVVGTENTINKAIAKCMETVRNRKLLEGYGA